MHVGALACLLLKESKCTWMVPVVRRKLPGCDCDGLDAEKNGVEVTHVRK